MLDLLALEDVFQRCLSAQPDLATLQRSDRSKCARHLRDFAVTADPPRPTVRVFSQQLLDLTHMWWPETEGPDTEKGDVCSLRQRLTYAKKNALSQVP